MKVTHETLFASTTDLYTLGAIGVTLCGMTMAQIEALAKKPNRGNARGAVQYMTLRATLAKKLQEGTHAKAYTAGTLEFTTPSDQAASQAKAKAKAEDDAKAKAKAEDDAKAKAKAKAEGAKAEGAKAEGAKTPHPRTKVPLQGAYTVGPKGIDPTNMQSKYPTKWEIWQHIWSSKTFEEFWSKCPAKGNKATAKQTVITPASEMAYALKVGWIVPSASK